MISFADYSPELMKEVDYKKNKNVDFNKLGHSSKEKLWWLCSRGHSYYTSVFSRTRNKKSGCPYCKGRKVLPGFNDLNTKFPSVAKDWDYKKNYPLTPSQISSGSAKKVWWICDRGHSYLKAPCKRTNKKGGCPICANKNVLAGYNDLATVRPDLLDKWNFKRNEVKGMHPSLVTAVSGKKVWWKCLKGHEWETAIAHVSNGRGCPICNTGKQTSFPEQVLFYYINKVDSTCESRYRINGKKELDIYIPKLKIGIEYDGYRWHNSQEKLNIDFEKQIFWNNLGVKIIRIKEQNRKVSHLKTGRWIKTDNEYYLKDEDYVALSGVVEDIIKVLYNKKILVDLDKDRNKIYNSYLFKEIDSSLSKNKKAMKYFNKEKNLELKPEYISRSSGKKIWWKCEQGHSFQATVHAIDQGKYCPICRKEMLEENGLISLDDKYIKSLKYSKKIKSLLNEFPEIAKEWNYEKNFPIKPENIVSRSGKKFWWKCRNCTYEWETQVANRVKGSGCPKCGRMSSAVKKFHPVLQFSKDGKLIKEYPSVKEAIEKTGVKHVSGACRGERKTAGGFLWKYK